MLVLAYDCSSQTYIPMLGQTNTWQAVSCLNGCVLDSYGTGGDTTISGFDYKILGGYHYIQGNFLIREDVSERKVYMKILGGHVLLDEFPLYDFSLQDGDTTHVYNPISPLPEDGGLFVLDSIISRTLETGEHRFFYLHAVDPIASVSESTVWVEGVGSLSLINSPGAGPTEGEHLGCAFKDGILQYSDTDSISACSLNSVPESSDIMVSVYPTVFTDVLNVDLPDRGLASIQVYSLQGSLVYASNCEGKSLTQISGAELPIGILLVQTQIDGSQMVSKVIHVDK